MRIALTGTPGTGKTITAKELSKVLKLNHVEIARIALEMGATGEEGVVDVDIVREKIEKMDNIIIDSHFAEMFDADLVFVLRCEPRILCERLKRRGYSKKKIRENVLAEILDYCLINALEYHDSEKVFEVSENPVGEIEEIVRNPAKERSLVFGSKTQFLTEENLKLVNCLE